MSMSLILPILVGVGLLLVVVFGLMGLFKAFYRKVDQGTALIVNDMSAQPKVHFTGALIIPVLYKAEEMQISLITLQVDRRGKEGLIWVKSKTLSPKSIGPFDGEDGGKPSAARESGMVQIGAIDKTGWLRTGDLGKLDKSGRVQITGREDDVVKVDGKRVALGEVEGCLEAFPKIKAAQATVVTDPMAGSMVIARVVTKQKCAAEEIIDHCARNLAPYKVPRRIEFVEAI